MTPDTQDLLLTLIAPPALRYELVDWLLENTEGGFSRHQGLGHGGPSHALSAVEQVAGGQTNDVYQLHGPEGRIRPVVLALADAFSGAGLHYWLTPVVDSGHI